MRPPMIAVLLALLSPPAWGHGGGGRHGAAAGAREKSPTAAMRPMGPDIRIPQRAIFGNYDQIVERQIETGQAFHLQRDYDEAVGRDGPRPLDGGGSLLDTRPLDGGLALDARSDFGPGHFAGGH